ncbi:MAG: uroporphyrinogen-III C-methyltransferase [Deltaproteobacteria bacterium]|nr:uroporphyrinogen-III C-methyltransferase [Deltaproteobacteria bacterium]
MKEQSEKGGKVYLIGAGPGDPGLLTIKAKEILQACDVVVYDYLANPTFLEYVGEEAEAIYVGKKSSQHTLSQEEINKLLVDLGKQGKRVARLKGGDPYIFGRGGEEAQELRENGIPFEVVPGITSAIAAPAYAGIPLSHRDFTSTIGIVTGHERPDKEKSAIDWEGLARSMGTLVFLMGVKNLSNICRNLMDHGRSPETPAAMVRWGTTPRQQAVTGTLATMPEIVEKAGIKPPAILVVGEVVTLRDSLNWFERRPLFGKRIVVTRARAQASDMRRKLEDLGAEVVQFPTIRIQPPSSWSPVDEAVERLNDFDWVIFSSVNGVKFFFERLFQKGRDVRDLGGKSIAAIGPQTAKELASYGLRADLVPNDYKAEGLLDVFTDEETRRILFPRAKVAREVLPETLRKRGHHVEVIPVYETVMEKPDADVMNSILSGDVDVITFTASSTVHNFVEIMGGKEKVQTLPGTIKMASIGPITSQTLRDYGLHVHMEAPVYTIDGLIQEIITNLSS